MMRLSWLLLIEAFLQVQEVFLVEHLTSLGPRTMVMVRLTFRVL